MDERLGCFKGWHAFQNRPHKSSDRRPSDWSSTFFNTSIFHYLILRKRKQKKANFSNMSVFDVVCQSTELCLVFFLAEKQRVQNKHCLIKYDNLMKTISIMPKICHSQTERKHQARPSLLESFIPFLALPQWCRIMIRRLYTAKSQVMHYELSVH